MSHHLSSPTQTTCNCESNHIQSFFKILCNSQTKNKMKIPSAFLPFYIATLCAIGCVSALPSVTSQDPGILENIEKTLDPCPDGWTHFNNYCYLVSTSVKSWSDAQKYCRSRGADLVKINSAEENEFVLNLVQKKAPSLQQVWIGLRWNSKHGNSKAFYWYDNSVPVYKNWAPHEPNGNAREPCGHMWTGHTSLLPLRASGYWNDYPCHVAYLRNGIVCKKLP